MKDVIEDFPSTGDLMYKPIGRSHTLATTRLFTTPDSVEPEKVERATDNANYGFIRTIG